MIDFELSSLANSCKGNLYGPNQIVSAVSTDSRTCKDAMFFALKGERFDGHDFLVKAMQAGATALVCSKPYAELESEITDAVEKGLLSVIVCNDTLRALGLAGKLVRAKSQALVTSLTGSCGKTTVKELCLSILSLMGNTLATKGNFNNDVGVPLTLLRLSSEHRYAVIEQGASHRQDIARTCEFVESQIALINNAGLAHIEGFGSAEGVYLGKSEILDDVFSRGGVGIVPSDSNWAERWRCDYAKELAQGRLKFFGTHEGDTVRVSEIKPKGAEVSFKLSIDAASPFAVTLKLSGEHNAFNAAAAAALAHCAGASQECILKGLLASESIGGRLLRHNFPKFCLIDDAYNASFNAVIAAEDVLGSEKGHRIMVLGDMGELGDSSVSLHEQCGQHAKGRVDELLCVGERTLDTVKVCDAGLARHFKNHDELLKYLVSKLQTVDYATVLVKGAHSMHMEQVVDGLKTWAGEQHN